MYGGTRGSFSALSGSSPTGGLFREVMAMHAQCTLERPRALVVDSNSDIHDLLRELLTNHGWQVSAVAGAKQLRERFTSPAPDVLLMGCSFSDGQWSDMLHDAREHWPETPAILFSGNPECEELIEEGRELGIFAFLSKPCPVGQLLVCVDRAREHKRCVQELKRLEQTNDDLVRELETAHQVKPPPGTIRAAA